MLSSSAASWAVSSRRICSRRAALQLASSLSRSKRNMHNSVRLQPLRCPRRSGEVNQEERAVFRDHPAFWLEEYGAGGEIMRETQPTGENSAELATEVAAGDLERHRIETSASVAGLVGNAEA